MTEQLLQGIKIIDFTRLLPGPIATHLMAQMGAEVVKVESPNRIDYARHGMAQVDGASTLYHQLNHNKTELKIDYNSPEGNEQIIDLIQKADAVIEQFRPGAMDAWGLGYEELKKINSGLIYVSITGYDQEGAFANEAGHDLNYLSYSGITSLAKDEEGKPIVSGTQFADIAGSYTAVVALQAGLIRKLKSGKGCFLNVPLADAVAPFLAIPYSFQSGEMDHRQFNGINGNVLVNYAVYKCADKKWVSLAALEIKFWNNFCTAVGREEWYRENQLELSVHQFDKKQVVDLFKEKSRDEWVQFLQGKDTCVAPVLEIEELESSKYHNDTFEEINTPNGKKVKTIALPIKGRN